MFNEILNKDELELQNSILNRILVAVKNFSNITSKYENELKLILLEMEEQKNLLSIPKRNGHYIDCVWADPACKCGPDTCLCCFRFWRPKYFTKKIVSIMGIDYILWSLKEEEEEEIPQTGF